MSSGAAARYCTWPGSMLTKSGLEVLWQFAQIDGGLHSELLGRVRMLAGALPSAD